MKAIPIERQAANDYVSRLHRHHKPTVGDKYRIAAEQDGVIVGVVQVGRPVSRILDDGKTVEVLRLCTDGTKNVCTFLLARAAHIAKEMGYQRIITYILFSENGDSLKAAGWIYDGEVKGREWSCPQRKRKPAENPCDKKRYVKWLCETDDGKK